MKEWLIAVFLGLFVGYTIINFFMVGAGLLPFNADYECNKPKKRIEIVFPGFQIGCYLGERVEE
jgi:hypothetical protein